MANCLEPLLDFQLGPRGCRELSSAAGRRRGRPGRRVHLNRDPGLFECDVVHQRIFNAVDVVVFVLQQKCGRRLTRDGHGRVQLQSVPAKVQVPRVDGHGEVVGPEAFAIGRIYRRVKPVVGVRADGGNRRWPPAEKTQHSHFVRIDLPLRGVQPHQTQRPLRILKCHRRLRIRAPIGS